MSAARNLGIRNSCGSWIAFLDADDVWLPDKLAEQRALVSSNPEAGLCYGSPLYWFSWSSELSRFRDCQPGISVPPETLVQPPELMLRNYPLGEGPAPCPSDMVVSRAVVDSVNGFEESFGDIYQMYEDQAFLAKVYLSAPVYVSGHCWTRYRQDLGSCTPSIRDSAAYGEVRRFFLYYLEQRLLAHGNRDPRIRYALERAWWPYRHPLFAKITRLYRRGTRRLRRFLVSLHALFQAFTARMKITSS
jgi:glycosyltransferase involved in cell wall biosynthesis